MTQVMDDHGTKEYRGHELHVQRVDVVTTDYRRPTTFEFELHVDGELLTTATQIERSMGYEAPWVSALFRYGKTYVRGMEEI
jgi:hypothetical protein